MGTTDGYPWEIIDFIYSLAFPSHFISKPNFDAKTLSIIFVLNNHKTLHLSNYCLTDR